MCLQRNTEARSCNHICRGKAISFTYYECTFVDLDNQHAQRMRRLAFSPLACPAYHIFPHHLTKGKFFGKKLLSIKCVFWFSSTTFVCNISHSKNNATSYYNTCTLGLQQNTCHSVRLKRNMKFLTHNYYSNKMHTFIIKSTRYYNLYFLSYILPLNVSTRVGHLQGAQCQCLAKVIINYNLLKLR
jgi:hypothetical protein